MTWQEEWNKFLAEAEKEDEDKVNSNNKEDVVDVCAEEWNIIVAEGKKNEVNSDEDDDEKENEVNSDEDEVNSDEDEDEDDIFPVPAQILGLGMEMKKPNSENETEMDKSGSEKGAKSNERRKRSFWWTPNCSSKRRAWAEAFSAL